MRSRTNCIISQGLVHSWARDLFLNAKLAKDHGWRCTAAVVLGIVFRAATRSISISAACRDLSNGPSDQAALTALDDGLPKTLPVLEKRLNDALLDPVPRRMTRRAWVVAIDWHLQPYYGQPEKSRNELHYGKPKQGTKHFHAYASVCIVEHGRRYTLALTWVQRHHSMAEVLRRLIGIVRENGLKIKRVLLDRAFFNVPVVQLLQEEKLPFVMPVMLRGPRPKKRGQATGLRWIKRQSAGWYTHTLNNRKQEATVSICVGYRRHRNRKDGKQRRQKLLFATWRVRGAPTDIRKQYRRRFGIETSYRQMRQGRIPTCTRSPRLRLFFLAVGLILRNLWVWIHHMHLAEGSENDLTLHLELLQFKQMLDWITDKAVALCHDGSEPYVLRPP